MSDFERRADDWLREHHEDLVEDAGGQHLDDARLASIADAGEALTAAELHHLARCAECREVHAALSQTNVVPLRRRRLWLGVAGLAAAAAILIVMRPAEDAGYRAKGEAQELGVASVALIATSTSGARRDLREGDTIRRGERLGFRYGNPGDHRTLTVLGWDGDQVHWFYPERASGAPAELESGALNRRLPFDVVIDEELGAELEVVAAFDADPDTLAEQLRSGARPEGVTVFRVQVQP
ncbi:MAG: hypothetical protein RMA76_39690 [Deltaproteobacteria bacterium]|jgi:hypothetical protein